MKNSTQESSANVLGSARDAVEHSVGRLYRKYLSEINITFPQFLMIAILSDGKPRTVREIAELLDVRSNTVTSKITLLESAGLVIKRQGSPGDRRVLNVMLTPKAIALAQQLIVIQARVDLEFGLLSEEVTRIRQTLLMLSRSYAKLPTNL